MLGGAWLLQDARYSRTSFKTPFVNAITAKHDARKKRVGILIVHHENIFNVNNEKYEGIENYYL